MGDAFAIHAPATRSGKKPKKTRSQTYHQLAGDWGARGGLKNGRKPLLAKALRRTSTYLIVRFRSF
jgi:hypothetical protein